MNPSISGRAKRSVRSPNPHTGSVAQPASYSMVTRGNVPGVQVAEAYS